MTTHGWVIVDRAPNTVVAQLWADYLQERGVPCFVDGSMLADERAAAMQLVGLLGVDVKTSGDHLDRARELIADLKARNEGRPSIKCAKCGETIDAAFDACWKCGSERPAVGSGPV
jgi:hypothetical protein